jgi:hypothetical protein
MPISNITKLKTKEVETKMVSEFIKINVLCSEKMVPESRGGGS